MNYLTINKLKSSVDLITDSKKRFCFKILGSIETGNFRNARSSLKK